MQQDYLLWITGFVIFQSWIYLQFYLELVEGSDKQDMKVP